MLKSRRIHVLSVAVACACGWSLPAKADAVSVNFESFAIGQLPGGLDTRAPGNPNTWYVPDNAATYGEVRAGIGLGGSNALVVGNRGNGHDGVIDNVKSGRLAQAAGETSSGAPNKSFHSEFWFRTESTAAVVDFAFKTESWGSDRTTWLGFFGGGAGGGLSVESSGVKADGTWNDNALGTALNWGQWYRVVTDVLFADGGAANDSVTYSIYDQANALIGTLLNNTWEEGQRQFGYNGGNQVAVDAIGFQSRFSPAVNGAVYIDDVSWASVAAAADVPEPGTLALVGAACLAGAAARRRAQRR